MGEWGGGGGIVIMSKKNSPDKGDLFFGLF